MRGVYILFDTVNGRLLKVGETGNWLTRFLEYASAQATTGRALAVRFIETPGLVKTARTALESDLRTDLESSGQALRWDNTDSRLLTEYGGRYPELAAWSDNSQGRLLGWLRAHPDW